MHQSFRALPTSTRATALLAAALLVPTSLAACGGDDETASTPSTPATTAEQLVAPVGTKDADPTPETESEGAGTVSSGASDKTDGDFTPPAGADAPGAERVNARKGLRLESEEGAKPRWIVKAKRGSEGEFCAHLSIPGPFDPDPVCQTGELIALQFFGDDASGPAIGTVVQAPLTRRESPSQLVVAGLTSGDVERVRVRYGTKLIDAKVTDDVVDVPIDRRMARELSGATKAQIDRLPNPVTVKAFGVSFPRDAGNPPRVVTPESAHAKDGVITLQLS